MKFGGLKKSASRAALIAAATVITTGAYAADLGGDCCADLEERVAELEATTARKGNRKVSLTISGQVNKAHHALQRRHQFQHLLGHRQHQFVVALQLHWLCQDQPDLLGWLQHDHRSWLAVPVRFLSSQTAAEAGDLTGHTGTGDLNDHSLFMRDAVVWIESAPIGRLSLGRLTQTGPQGTIDLGGIGVIAPGTSLVGNALRFHVGGGCDLQPRIGGGL